MKTIVSTKGQIVLPVEIRERDHIEPGQEFDVERIEEGKYQLTRATRKPNEGLVKLLLSCPSKGWFRRARRTETTDDIKIPNFK